MTTPEADKKKLRKELTARRDAVPLATRRRAAQKIAEIDFTFTGLTSGTVSGFHPFHSEIDARPLMTKLGDAGYITALPVITAKDRPLKFRAWKPGDPLIDGVWNIPVPPETAEDLIPDIILVPLLGFDNEGYRIGYGGGFYDRTLEQLGKTKKIIAVGLAYSTQHVAYIPREAHDIALDWILTELGPKRVMGPEMDRIR